MLSGNVVQVDLNLNFWLQNLVALGISYRSEDAIVSLFEVQATPQFRFGYAYDLTLTALQNYSSGSHEMMLRYEFGSRKSKNKVVSPRYF
jgi:hypothetical protein